MAFEIGSTYAGMKALDNLDTPVEDPFYTFKPWAKAIELGSGGVRGAGFASATWHWDVIPIEQRSQLKSFCSGKSADIFIKTRDDDGNFDIFEGKMVWPGEEEQRAGNIIDLTIEFIHLTEYTP